MQAKLGRSGIEQGRLAPMQPEHCRCELTKDIVHHGHEVIDEIGRKDGGPVTGDSNVEREPRPRRMS